MRDTVIQVLCTAFVATLAIGIFYGFGLLPLVSPAVTTWGYLGWGLTKVVAFCCVVALAAPLWPVFLTGVVVYFLMF